MQRGWMWALAVGVLCLPVGASGEESPCGVGATAWTPDADNVALLVSIDGYDDGKTRPLRGTNNDMTRLCGLLKERGFEDAGILRLTESAATRAGILGQLDRLAEGPADRNVVFAFAGHGSQTEALGTDEADNKDETLCPYDRLASGDIRDDELDAKFGAILASDAWLTVILDSCHSGTATRSADDVEGSELAWRIAEPVDPPKVAKGAKRKARYVSPSESERFVAVSAAQSWELAGEKYDLRSRAVHGIFSTSVAKALTEAPEGSSWSDIWNRVERPMPPNQRPLLTGNGYRALLGKGLVSTRPRPRVVSKAAAAEDGAPPRIIIDWGVRAGLGMGGLLALYAADAPALHGDEGFLGFYEIDAVAGVGGWTKLDRARARLLKAPEGVDPMAIDVEMPPQVQVLRASQASEALGVFVEEGVPDRDVLLEAVEADLRLAVVANAKDVTPRTFRVMRGKDGCLYVEGGPTLWPHPGKTYVPGTCDLVVGRDGELRTPGFTDVLNVLLDAASWLSFSRLVAPPDERFVPSEVLSVAVERRQEGPGGEQSWVPIAPDASGAIPVGDCDVFRLKYGPGTSPRRAYVTVLSLSNDYTLASLNGAQFSEALGSTSEPVVGRARRVRFPVDGDRLRLYVGSRPFNPASYRTRDIHSESSAASGQWWMGELLDRRVTRANEDEPFQVAPQPWGIIDLPFRPAAEPGSMTRDSDGQCVER